MRAQPRFERQGGGGLAHVLFDDFQPLRFEVDVGREEAAVAGVKRLIDGQKALLFPEAGKVEDVAVQNAVGGEKFAGAFAARRAPRARCDERPLRRPAALPKIGKAVLARNEGVGDGEQPVRKKRRQNFLLFRFGKAGDSERLFLHGIGDDGAVVQDDGIGKADAARDGGRGFERARRGIGDARAFFKERVERLSRPLAHRLRGRQERAVEIGKIEGEHNGAP